MVIAIAALAGVAEGACNYSAMSVFATYNDYGRLPPHDQLKVVSGRVARVATREGTLVVSQSTGYDRYLSYTAMRTVPEDLETLCGLTADNIGSLKDKQVEARLHRDRAIVELRVEDKICASYDNAAAFGERVQQWRDDTLTDAFGWFLLGIIAFALLGWLSERLPREQD